MPRPALAIALGVGAAGAGVALLGTSAWLISRAAEHPPVLYLMVAIVAVRMFALLRATLRYAERLVAHDAAFRALGDLRERVYLRLERLVPVGVADLSSADLVSRLVGDVDAVVDRLVRVRLPVAVATVTSAGAVAVMWALSTPIGAVLGAASAFVLVGVPSVVRLAGAGIERSMAPARARLAVETKRLLTAAPDLVAYGAAAEAVARVAHADAELRRIERRSAWTQGLGTALLLAVLGGAVWSALRVGVPAVDSGSLSPVLLAVVVLVPLGLVDVLALLPGAAALTDRNRTAMARVDAVLSTPDPVPEPARPMVLPTPSTLVLPASAAPARASAPDLRLENVRARWSTSAPWVLNGVDLDLPAGRRVAVMGASGCGKSTLAAVLLRLLEVGDGQLFLGSEDARRLAGDDVRRLIGLCAQDAYIFDTTIRDNLRLARPDATDEDLVEALDAARLRTWVEGLPRGLDTRVGEHGGQLSGGERQRLALARVLLADAPVVVFDEPTEHLDDETAQELTRDLLEATSGRTVVLLTHRRPPAEWLDATYELVDGRLRLLGSTSPAEVPGRNGAANREIAPTSH